MLMHGTLNLLELTKKYCPSAPFILCLLIKFMEITQINLKLLKKKKMGIKRKYIKKVKENFL